MVVLFGQISSRNVRIIFNDGDLLLVIRNANIAREASPAVIQQLRQHRCSIHFEMRETWYTDIVSRSTTVYSRQEDRIRVLTRVDELRGQSMHISFAVPT